MLLILLIIPVIYSIVDSFFGKLGLTRFREHKKFTEVMECKTEDKGEQMLTYMNWVNSWPIISAMIQFAILGTLGEIVSKWIIQKNFKYPFGLWLTLRKMLVWALLAVGIKYAFKGFGGFLQTLIDSSMWPRFAEGSFGQAFSLSVLMNLQFGPTMVIMHRVLDNIPEKVKNWNNMDKSMYSLLWFWIPAHTVTFMMPDMFRMGLAAVWSVALGLILGFYNRK